MARKAKVRTTCKWSRSFYIRNKRGKYLQDGFDNKYTADINNALVYGSRDDADQDAVRARGEQVVEITTLNIVRVWPKYAR